MNRSDALEALRTAAVDVLQVKPDQVTESATFAEDLEADSLDVKIEEDDLGEVKTVGDAVDLIIAASAANA